MLIQLKSIHIPQQAKPKEDIARAFNLIVHSEVEGANLLIVDDPPEQYDISDVRDTYGFFIANALSNISSRYVENSSYKDLASVYIVIDFDYARDYKHIEDGKIIHFGYGWILDSNLCRPSVLLLEDKYDRRVYDLCCSYFKYKYGLEKYPTRLRYQHGGGSATPRNFIDHLESRDNVLCIVDSDKRHPNGKLGETANGFNGRDHVGAVWELVILQLHEAENLIPISLYKESYRIIKENGQVESIEQLEKTLRELVDSLKYFDFKKGLSAHNLAVLDSAYGRYWGNIAQDVTPERCFDCVSDPGSFRKIKKGQYKCNKNNSCVIFKPICSDVASRITVLEEAKTDINRLLDESQIQYQEQTQAMIEIGAKIFSWGICGEFVSSS